MRVLLGETTGKTAERIRRRGWGRVWIARGRNIYTYPGEPWILDNGAYRDHGKRAWSSNLWYAAMSKANGQATPPMGVVLPDRIGGGADSLAWSMAWADAFEDGFYPWYLAVQNGMTPEMVAPHVDRLVGIFLGGDKRFKMAEGETWATFARAHGLAFHYGSCGTPEKVRHAKRLGADSIDSALPMWSRQKWEAFETAVRGDQTEFEFSPPTGGVLTHHAHQ